MRILVLALIATFGCKSPEEMMQEAIMEGATGAEVEIKDGKMVVKGEDGEEVTITTKGEGAGKMVVTGKDGEKGTITAEDGKVRIEGKDGTMELGATDLPDDFPLPMLEGAEIISSMHADSGKGKTFNVNATTDKTPKEVADFYAKALKSEGFKVKRAEHKMGGQAMITLNGRKKKVATAAVTVVREEKEDKTTLSIMWNPK